MMSLRVYHTIFHSGGISEYADDGEPAFDFARLANLRRQFAADELLLVAGPQQIELYMAGHEASAQAESKAVLEFLQKSLRVSVTTCHLVQEREAAKYFFRSALGWMSDGGHDDRHAAALRKAVMAAQNRGEAGTLLNRLYERALWLSEKVRVETDFFEHTASIASATIELAQKIFGGLKSRHALVVGGNHEASRTAQALRDANIGGLFVAESNPRAGRMVKSVSELALPTNGAVGSEADLILIFEPLVANLQEPRTLQKLMSKRNHAPLLVIDLANKLAPVPALQKMSNLYFFARADLDRMIAQNLQARQEVERKITHWIETEAAQFMQWAASDERFHFGAMVGSSRQIQHVFELIARIARTDITVLIQGESGTGKELVAAAIHEASGRAEQPFVVVNCSAIPENLLESELFGHVRGAFTGAINNKKGLFEEANNGTIFLDEIAELSPPLQVKLLRFLQENEIKPVGSNTTLRLNVRVIAASNRNLFEMVKQGQFRSDLFYRLNVIQIDLPPLRQRPEDIPVLARHFLHKFAARMRKPSRELAPEAMQKLAVYHWPGNVRELENVIERAVALSASRELGLLELPENIRELASEVSPENSRLSLKEVERQHILETLKHCEWNYDEAAQVLRIGRTTLWRKLKEYQVEKSA